jgi:hypothetical protein
MSTPLLNHVIRDQRAWTAATLDASTAWYYRLPDACLSLLDQALSKPGAVTILVVDEAQRRAGRELLRPALADLETGRGFVVLDGLPVERYSTEQAQALYWLIGQLLGQPFEQNVQGTLLYDVRDYGQDVAKGARFSVTNAESTFHTDNSFGGVLDYIGLLCLNPARAGGLSQVISGYAVHNVLLEEHADVLPTLYAPFHVDRRGGVREGEAPTVQVPVIAWDGRELLFRYLRYWIEAGHQKVEQPLTPAQVRALDVLDEVLRRPELRVEFPLRRGQMLFTNNRWTLHNRTAFEDHPEPERRRHLIRLWLRAQAS